jgi:hypothetical protein
MTKPSGRLRHILIWTYERGTLPYDIICALILAFIFLVPRGCFVNRTPDATATGAVKTSQPPPAPSTKIP